MANLNVTYADMRDAAGRLRAGKDDMETKLSELGSLIDGLVAGGFQTDQASHHYQDTFHKFQTGTRQAIDALDGLAQFLDQAAEALSQTDSQLSSSIGN
jgi:WXG100 family type VII secretion target